MYRKKNNDLEESQKEKFKVHELRGSGETVFRVTDEEAKRLKDLMHRSGPLGSYIIE